MRACQLSPVCMTMANIFRLGLDSTLWEEFAGSLFSPTPSSIQREGFFPPLFFLATLKVSPAMYGRFKGSKSFVI